MFLEVNGKNYDIATTLGTAYDLENKFKQKITYIIDNISNLGIKDMCNYMYVGIKRNDKNIEFEDFFNNVLDSGIKIVDLQREFSIFITLLISSDKTEEEIRKDYNKKVKDVVKEFEEKENNEKN